MVRQVYWKQASIQNTYRTMAYASCCNLLIAAPRAPRYHHGVEVWFRPAAENKEVL